MLLHVLLSFWEDTLDDQWWTGGSYEPDLWKLKKDVIARQVVAVGKVVGFPCHGKFDISLQCNILDDEVNKISSRDLRRFIIPRRKLQGAGSEAGRKTGAEENVETADSDDMIEDSDAVSEDEGEVESDESKVESSNEDCIESGGKQESTDTDFFCWDHHIKDYRHWKYAEHGVRETPYFRPRTQPAVNNIRAADWESITAYGILTKNMPKGEIELWVQLTTKSLVGAKFPGTTLAEMKIFLACLLALTQGRKKGGIKKAFEPETDGLFPASDLGRFGIKYYRFKQILTHWTFAAASEVTDGSSLD